MTGETLRGSICARSDRRIASSTLHNDCLWEISHSCEPFSTHPLVTFARGWRWGTSVCLGASAGKWISQRPSIRRRRSLGEQVKSADDAVDEVSVSPTGRNNKRRLLCLHWMLWWRAIYRSLVPPAGGDSPARPGSCTGVRLCGAQRGCRNVSNKCSKCGSLILFQRKRGRREMEILYRILSRERNTAIGKPSNDQHPRISCSLTAPFKRIYTLFT